MSGVMVRNSFALHPEVIVQEFCSICQLLDRKQIKAIRHSANE